MQFTNLFALVAASSLSTGFLSVLAAPAPIIQGSVVGINVLGSQDHLDHASPAVHTTQNGRLEAHWAFFVHAGKEIDYLYVDFYNGDAASPTCSDSWSITQLSLQGQLNGLGFAGPNCAAAGTPTYVIFDANRPGATVQTYGAANGVNCGWTSSPDHQEISQGPSQSDDYYFHCSW